MYVNRRYGRVFLLMQQHLSRRREHLHARALQIRAELSTHIHRETGPQRPTHSFWSFLFFEKTKLECGKKPPAFCQRQAHNAVRHAARSRPARSAPGHRARTRASSRGPPGRVCMWSGVRARICQHTHEKWLCRPRRQPQMVPVQEIRLLIQGVYTTQHYCWH